MSYLQNMKAEDVSPVFDKPGEWKDLHGDRTSSKNGPILIETQKMKKGYEAHMRVRGYGLLVEIASLGDDNEADKILHMLGSGSTLCRC